MLLALENIHCKNTVNRCTVLFYLCELLNSGLSNKRFTKFTSPQCDLCRYCQLRSTIWHQMQFLATQIIVKISLPLRTCGCWTQHLGYNTFRLMSRMVEAAGQPLFLLNLPVKSLIQGGGKGTSHRDSFHYKMSSQNPKDRHSVDTCPANTHVG